MFDDTSRYAGLPLKAWTDAQGRERAYVSRRIIPERRTIVGEMKVRDGDRLDLIANRAYAEPRAFWRIADANPDPSPETLADEPGRRLKVSMPEPGGG